jgi:AcrR family transcriptional regulator
VRNCEATQHKGPAMEHSDHRTRVGAERRHRMHLRLIENALLVFAEKGLDRASIDDVIAAAGVSRGTFYNYFRTDADLAAAVSEELTTEMIGHIEARVGHLANPAERVARGLRLYLGAAEKFPLFARFTAQAGFRAVSPNQLLREYLPRHIVEGVKSGRMVAPDVSLAVDMIVGAALSAVHALSTRTVHRRYAENAVMHILVGLGVTRAAARKLAYAPVDDIEPPPDSLLARTQPPPSNAVRRASVA